MAAKANDPSPRDTLQLLEEQRDSAARRMLIGITQMMEAHLDAGSLLQGLEYARTAALDYEKFVMGEGPLSTCLFKQVEP